ncbi:hypothetical protein F5146DRAFT_1120070 [Armillaria mellea]|nr:hypothetical protein F5146DRAFT_1120070 [Armillaria mellea]
MTLPLQYRLVLSGDPFFLCCALTETNIWWFSRSSKYSGMFGVFDCRVYWGTQGFQVQQSDVLMPRQPFVFSNGDPTGYGYHADFFNGWEPGILQRAIDECHCNPYGDPSCCVAAGTFTINQTARCFVSNTVDEITTGRLATLPGANPVQAPCYEAYTATYTPAIVGPVYVSTQEGAVPSGETGVVVPARTVDGGGWEPEGTCIWTGGATSRGVPVGVLVVCIFGTIWSIL